MQVETQQLRYFCAVARAGNFTRAAVAEGITQPSLSQQIARLEQAVGARLFDRLGRSVQLTEAGRSLLPEALEILRRINDARARLASLNRNVAGRLTIGCIPTVTPYFLAPHLQEFAQRFPNVELRLVEDLTPKLVELLQIGELDLAVVSPPVGNRDVVCSDLFREPVLVAVSRDHRLAAEPAINLPELNGERLILLREGHCFRNNALTACQRARATFESVFETNQFSSILPLVAAGFGLSLVPEMAVDAASGCVFRPLARESFRRIGYMRVRPHSLGGAQKAFIEWLRAISRLRSNRWATAGA